MKKLNFNQPFVGFDGKPIVDERNQPLIIGKFLANQIARSEATDKAMEKYELCHKLSQDGLTIYTLRYSIKIICYIIARWIE